MSVIRAVLLDLDDTLISTSHLESVRRNGQRDVLQKALPHLQPYQYVQEVLQSLQAQYKLAIVSRAPRWYVTAILAYVFPTVSFETVIAYDDVESHRQKPYPHPIRKALEHLGVESNEAIYVGDNRDDMEAAYHAGARAVLAFWGVQDQEAYNLLPDGVVKDPRNLIDLARNPAKYLPTLEAVIAGESKFQVPRYIEFPMYDSVKERCFVLGRYFPPKSLTVNLHERSLSSQLIALKYSDGTFAIDDKLIQALWASLGWMLKRFSFDVLTVVPAKQGKDPRLERLLEHLRDFAEQHQIVSLPSILQFSEDASSIKELGKRERLQEIRRSLAVKYNLSGRRILILDDVLTTGATLVGAKQKLLEAGAEEVFLLSLTRTISDYAFHASPEEKLCPAGKPMVIRTNSRDGSRFYGCSEYKTCKCGGYTENISKSALLV